MEEGPVLHEGSAQLSGEGTIHARATLYRTVVRPLELGAVFGGIGSVVALISALWFTPQGGFDGWWTRLSEGFAIAGLPSGFLSWAMDWRVELEWERLGGRAWGLRIRNLCLKDRRGRPLISGWRLIAVPAIPTALCALVCFAIAQGWP